MLDRVTEMTVAVYSRAADEAFSEKFVSRGHTFLTKDVKQTRVITARHDKPVTQLRIDFSEYKILFYLDSLIVSQESGATIFIWTPDYDWRANSVGMTFKRTRNGTLLECESGESSLLIAVPQAISDTNLVVTFSIRSVFGTSSLDAVDNGEVRALNHLLAEQEDLSRYVNALQRSHDDNWAKTQTELSKFRRQWTTTDDTLTLIKHAQSDVSIDLAELKSNTGKSIDQLTGLHELHERHKVELSERLTDLSDRFASADKAGADFRSDLSLRNEHVDAALNAVESQLSAQVQTVEKAARTIDALDTASKESVLKLDALDTASRQSVLKLGTIEEKLDAQIHASREFHDASLFAINDTGSRQLKHVEDKAAELKLYVRTGINAIRRDIDDANAISEVRRVEDVLTIQYQQQMRLLEDIFESLSNIKHSKGVNIGSAARIMASNYRFRGSENFTDMPRDLPQAIAIIGNLRGELLETRGMLETVLRSRSWRLMRPVRFVLRLIHRVLRRART